MKATSLRSGVAGVRARLVGEKFWEFFFLTFATLIKSIKHKLIIKLITQIDEKSQDESIKPN